RFDAGQGAAARGFGSAGEAGQAVQAEQTKKLKEVHGPALLREWANSGEKPAVLCGGKKRRRRRQEGRHFEGASLSSSAAARRRFTRITRRGGKGFGRRLRRANGAKEGKLGDGASEGGPSPRSTRGTMVSPPRVGLADSAQPTTNAGPAGL